MPLKSRECLLEVPWSLRKTGTEESKEQSNSIMMRRYWTNWNSSNVTPSLPSPFSFTDIKTKHTQETSKIKSKTYQCDQAPEGINFPFPVIFAYFNFVFLLFASSLLAWMEYYYKWLNTLFTWVFTSLDDTQDTTQTNTLLNKLFLLKIYHKIICSLFNGNRLFPRIL